MNITVITDGGKIKFRKVEPGQGATASINKSGQAPIRVTINTQTFSQSIQSDFGGFQTMSVSTSEDNMVRVWVNIHYKDSNTHIDLGKQEHPINVKKIKFIDIIEIY